MPIEHYIKNGLVHVPKYGVFLPNPDNKMGFNPRSVPEFKLSDAEYTKVEYIRRLPAAILTHLIRNDVFNDAGNQARFEDDFTLELVVDYKGKPAAIRSHVVSDRWKIYALKDFDTYAAAFVAPHWNDEPIAVVDYIDGKDDRAIHTLHQALDHIFSKDHEAIRACHGIPYEIPGQNLVDMGYRLMNRTDEEALPFQDLDFIKFYGLDADIIDNAGTVEIIDPKEVPEIFTPRSDIEIIEPIDHSRLGIADEAR